MVAQQTNKPLAEAERKLTMLLLEVRGSEIAERVRLYVAKFANGRNLSEHLRDESIPAKERAVLAERLIEILLTKDYGRLPEIPAAPAVKKGNAGGDSEARAVAPTASDSAVSDDAPAPDELREMIREEVRREMAGMLEMIARALREKS